MGDTNTPDTYLRIIWSLPVHEGNLFSLTSLGTNWRFAYCFRTPSIWDTFTHPYPGTGKRTTTDGLSEDDAADYFNEWKENIALLKLYLANSYRFSLSWTLDRHGPGDWRKHQHYRKLIELLGTVWHHSFYGKSWLLWLKYQLGPSLILPCVDVLSLGFTTGPAQSIRSLAW